MGHILEKAADLINKKEPTLSPEIDMAFKIVLLYQAKIKGLRDNEPFEYWSYEKVRDVFLAKDKDTK